MDMDQLKQILAAQQQQHQEAMAQQQQTMAQQQQAIAQMVALLQQRNGGGDNALPAPIAPPAISTLPQLPDMEIFSADDSDPSKFEDWMARFKFSLDCTAPNMVDLCKVKLLMTKLSSEAFSEYRKSCLPRDVVDFNLDETVSGLSKLFAHSRSLVVDRFECLRLVKDEGEEFRHYVNRLKGQLRLFKFSSLKEEEFNCLLLLLGLKSNQDAALRTRLLHRINEKGEAVKFEEIMEGAAAYLSTIAEAKHLERRAEPYSINAVVAKRETPQNSAAQNRAPPHDACYRCDQMHWSEECPFFHHICSNCKKTGHVESQCHRFQNFKSNAAKKKFQPNRRINMVQLPSVMLSQVSPACNLLSTAVLVNGTAIDFTVDCGAQVNTLNQSAIAAIGGIKILPTNFQGCFLDGTKCNFLGESNALFHANGLSSTQNFAVVKSGCPNLLGLPAMSALGFLSKRLDSLLPYSSNTVEICRSSEMPAAKDAAVTGALQVNHVEPETQQAVQVAETSAAAKDVVMIGALQVYEDEAEAQLQEPVSKFSTAAAKVPCEHLLKPAAFASAAMMSSGHLPNSASSSTAAVTSNGCLLNSAASAASEVSRKRLVKSAASASAVKVPSKHIARPTAAVLPTKPLLSKPCWNSHYSPRQSNEPSLLKREGEEMVNARNALSSRAALLSSSATRQTLAVLLDAFQLPPMLKSAAALPVNSCAALDAGGGASLLKRHPEECFKKKHKKESSHLPNPIKGGGVVSLV